MQSADEDVAEHDLASAQDLFHRAVGAAYGVALGLTAHFSRGADWRSWQLIALLVALSVASEQMTIEVRGLYISGAFIALVLAMTLLGPAPAVAMSVTSDALLAD